MVEWTAITPWWVFVGLVAAIVGSIFKFARWTGRVDNGLDSLADMIREGLAEVRTDIRKIPERPTRRPAVESASPVRPADFGKEISTTGSALEWARTHAPDLTADAREKEEFEISDPCVAYHGKPVQR